jgi:protein O-mannosyl-transferase
MPPSPERLPKRGKHPDLLGMGLVVAVALAASLAGIGNGFAQDDVVLIAQNARIHQLANWREIIASPYWPPPWSPDLYRPLMALLLAFEFALGGGSPLVFRVLSYLLYAAAALLVFTLGKRLLPRGVALAAALVFAAHPVHVEAVALGVGQNELLVGLLAGFMTALYLDRRRAGTGSLSGGDWVVLAALYAGASLLKEQGLVLPGLLLAAELFLLQGPARERLRRLAPGYGVLASLGVLLLLLRRAVFSGSVAGTFAAEALQGVGPAGRALTLLQVVPHWVRLLVWPVHLQADYSPQELVASRGLGPAEALGLAILAGAVAVIWLARRRAPVVSFGLSWMAVALLPVSNVLIATGILLAERTLFLPSIGFVIAMGGLLTLLWPGVTEMRGRARVAFGLVCAGLVVTGVLRSAARQPVWRDETAYSLQLGQDAPRSWRAQKAYGYVLFQAGERQAAMNAYQRAIEFAPSLEVWRVRNDLALRYLEEGRAQSAIEELRRSLAASPEQDDTRHYLILAYLAQGAYREAAAEADSALSHGGERELFEGLRALADTAARDRAPPGSIKIRVHGPGQ